MAHQGASLKQLPEVVNLSKSTKASYAHIFFCAVWLHCRPLKNVSPGTSFSPLFLFGSMSHLHLHLPNYKGMTLRTASEAFHFPLTEVNTVGGLCAGSPEQLSFAQGRSAGNGSVPPRRGNGTQNPLLKNNYIWTSTWLHFLKSPQFKDSVSTWVEPSWNGDIAGKVSGLLRFQQAFGDGAWATAKARESGKWTGNCNCAHQVVSTGRYQEFYSPDKEVPELYVHKKTVSIKRETEEWLL